MNKFVLVVSGLFMLTLFNSCNSLKDDDDYIHIFLKDKEKYVKTIDYIEKKYTNENCKEARLVFLNCKEYKRTLPVERCDEYLTSFMERSNIRSINFEKEEKWCDTSRCFDKVYFMISKKDYYPIVYYVYDYCNNQRDSESEKVVSKSIMDNWSLLVDKNR